MFKDGWFVEDFEGQTGGLSFKVDDFLFEETSPYQKVTVIHNSFLGNVMLLDELVMVTEKDEFYYHDMLVHVPLMCVDNPKEVLIIGGGDGGSVREALKHPSIERVVLCEIDRMVIDVARKYFPALSKDLDDLRVEIHVGDGIEYIRNHKESFDCILIDSTDPIGPAEGLFTVDFYHNVKAALCDGGAMSAQTESPAWSMHQVAMIRRKIEEVYGKAHLYLLPAPTYPSGLWSCTLALKSNRDHLSIDEERAKALAEQCRYYNAEIHWAAFVLPNFVREAL